MEGATDPLAAPTENEGAAQIEEGGNKSNNGNDGVFEDRRPLISDLLAEYQDLIQEFEDRLSGEELYDPNKHDDLWMLRFLLSHKKNVDRALSAAKETLEFRKRYKLDDKDIRSIPPQDIKEANDATSRAFQTFLDHGVPRNAIRLVVPDTTACGVVVYLNIKDIDTHKLGKMEQGDWIAGVAYVNEWQFQWNDYITRTTGRLTKSIQVIDVSGIHLSMYDKKTQGKYTTAGKEMQNCYPQGVQSYFVCHSPIWIEGPWKILKPLLPVRVVSKLDFLNPKHRRADREKIFQFIPRVHLLPQFGGDSEN